MYLCPPQFPNLVMFFERVNAKQMRLSKTIDMTRGNRVDGSCFLKDKHLQDYLGSCRTTTKSPNSSIYELNNKFMVNDHFRNLWHFSAMQFSEAPDHLLTAILSYEEHESRLWSSLPKKAQDMLKTRIEKSPIPLVVLLLDGQNEFCPPEHQNFVRLVTSHGSLPRQSSDQFCSLKVEPSLTLEYPNDTCESIVRIHFCISKIESSPNFIQLTGEELNSVILNDWVTDSEPIGTWKQEFEKVASQSAKSPPEPAAFKFLWSCPLCKFKYNGREFKLEVTHE
ncbi:hypothetical protein Ciccas_009997 [Cichlidogyrus casuarinus]|uniref:Uncharacterized protein n=1 Tax=Cichlidogyrus casuarinus TaxID=1844966 RepID=A0ABD2PVE2_9PLAT